MKKDILAVLFFALALAFGAYNQPTQVETDIFVEPVVGVDRPSCVVAGAEIIEEVSIDVEENQTDILAEAYEDDLLEVYATAYYDEFNRGHGADMSPLVEGLTVAGKIEWLGKSVYIYDEDMNYLGIYEFRDTGYGRSTGYGESRVLPGKSLGTIETGETIDIYFDTKEECYEWGKRKVYIKIVDAEG